MNQNAITRQGAGSRVRDRVGQSPHPLPAQINRFHTEAIALADPVGPHRARKRQHQLQAERKCHHSAKAAIQQGGIHSELLGATE